MHIPVDTPNQKISFSKKTKQWYIDNLEIACAKTRTDSNQNTYKNQLENYNLARGILDVYQLGKELDLQNLGVHNLPIPLTHIGIGNSKLNVLLGDYYSSPFDFRCTVSSKDEESVSRKEKDFMSQLIGMLAETLQAQYESGYVDEKALEKRSQEIDEWSKYSFQDLAEITANKLLKYEVQKNDIMHTLSLGFKNFLTVGKVAFLLDDNNGDIVFESLEPFEITSYGGSSKFLHEKDYILIERYRSVGQLYDAYYDDFTKDHRKKLENFQKGNFSEYYDLPVVSPGFLIDQSEYGQVFTGTNTPNNIFVAKANEFSKLLGEGGIIKSKPNMNNQGELLETTVFWKSRRKILELTTLDELGIPQISYVGEGYIADEFAGESIKELWVNEWCRCTKIGDDIYVKYGPVKGSAKSLTNLSTGLPPIIGIEIDYSMFDAIKKLDLEYDKVFWKRSVLMSQIQGTKTAVNISMIPEGYDPKMWLAMSNIDQILLLDPTREILTGPMEGKTAAQATNTFVTQAVDLGSNYQQIQALSDFLIQLEYTMGKVCGVNGTREGEIGERQAVRNTQFEITQFSKITEHWFQMYNRLTKTVFKKLLEVCKYVYKDNPVKGSYIFNDLGQEFIKFYSEFCETEFDIHTNRPVEDKELFEKLKISVEQTINSGKGDYNDMLALYSSGSIQDIAKKLRSNSQRILEEQKAINQQMEEAKLKEKLLEAEENEKTRDHEIKLKLMDIEIKKYEIDVKASIAENSNSNNNSLDLVNDNKLDLADIHFKNKQLEETVRHNKTVESINKERNSISRIQKKTPNKTK